MSALCLMPPTVNSVTECSENLPTLIRFYDVMAKCIRLVQTHDDELNMLLLGVIQSSIVRCQSVPENSVSLRCCHEAIEMSGLPKTLMELIDNVPNQTFFSDLLKLSFNLAVVSDRSALQMMQSDGVNVLVAALKPNFLLFSSNSNERLTVCEFVVLLLNRMFSLKRVASSTTLELPRITRNTLEWAYTILFN
uniref:Uncharacterized protein n=1 Tax=Sipha flava TaxID=143950 RepID=A0A2S2Q3I6_9HEMI